MKDDVCDVHNKREKEKSINACFRIKSSMAALLKCMLELHEALMF